MLRWLFGCTVVLASAFSQAAPVPLLDAIRCGAGNAANGILVTDVTGNAGGATECWGTYDGNDEGPSGDGYSVNGQEFQYVARQNTPGTLDDPLNIGLSITPPGGATSGSWSFTPGALGGRDFLIVLKAASSPGYAVWLFAGAHAASFSGDWKVAWAGSSGGPALSHLTIYRGERTTRIPIPGTLALIALGLLGARFHKARPKA